jgi:Zn-dependent protease
VTLIFGPVVEHQLPGIGPAQYAVSFAFGLLLGLSILVHELSHSVVALRFGLPVRRMTLYLLGGVSIIDREPETPRRELAISAAGPILSLVLAVVAWFVYRALEPHTIPWLLAGEVAIANALVGLFNLLPGLPLDGGRMLRAAVWAVTKRPATATVVAAHVGRGLALVVVGIPLFASLAWGAASLANILWSALIAAFMWSGATSALRNAKLAERLPRLSARTLTRRALPVAADLPLAEALRRAHAAGARGLVIVDTEGKPTGVVNEAAIAATPEERRPWISVGTVARRLEQEMVISADLAGEDLLRALQRVPASEYLVVLPGGAVYGVLAISDVEAAVSA